MTSDKVHDLKTWPDPFADVSSGRKNYEIRRNDRGFAVGHTLRLREWDPEKSEYTERELWAKITHMVEGEWGLPAGLAVLGIDCFLEL